MLRSKADDSISTAVQEAAVCILSPLKLFKNIQFYILIIDVLFGISVTDILFDILISDVATYCYLHFSFAYCVMFLFDTSRCLGL